MREYPPSCCSAQLEPLNLDIFDLGGVTVSLADVFYTTLHDPRIDKER